MQLDAVPGFALRAAHEHGVAQGQHRGGKQHVGDCCTDALQQTGRQGPLKEKQANCGGEAADCNGKERDG